MYPALQRVIGGSLVDDLLTESVGDKDVLLLLGPANCDLTINLR